MSTARRTAGWRSPMIHICGRAAPGPRRGPGCRWPRRPAGSCGRCCPPTRRPSSRSSRGGTRAQIGIASSSLKVQAIHGGAPLGPVAVERHGEVLEAEPAAQRLAAEHDRAAGSRQHAADREPVDVAEDTGMLGPDRQARVLVGGAQERRGVDGVAAEEEAVLRLLELLAAAQAGKSVVFARHATLRARGYCPSRAHIRRKAPAASRYMEVPARRSHGWRWRRARHKQARLCYNAVMVLALAAVCSRRGGSCAQPPAGAQGTLPPLQAWADADRNGRLDDRETEALALAVRELVSGHARCERGTRRAGSTPTMTAASTSARCVRRARRCLSRRCRGSRRPPRGARGSSTSIPTAVSMPDELQLALDFVWRDERLRKPHAVAGALDQRLDRNGDGRVEEAEIEAAAAEISLAGDRACRRGAARTSCGSGACGRAAGARAAGADRAAGRSARGGAEPAARRRAGAAAHACRPVVGRPGGRLRH